METKSTPRMKRVMEATNMMHVRRVYQRSPKRRERHTTTRPDRRLGKDRRIHSDREEVQEQK